MQVVLDYHRIKEHLVDEYCFFVTFYTKIMKHEKMFFQVLLLKMVKSNTVILTNYPLYGMLYSKYTGAQPYHTQY